MPFAVIEADFELRAAYGVTRGELVLGEFTGSEGQKRRDALGVRCRQPVAVQIEEQLRHDEARAFVAVQERVVAGDAESVAGRELRNRRLAARKLIAWPYQRGLEQSTVADAGLSTVLGELLVVNCEHDLEVDPDGLGHDSRSRLLREFAQRSATLLHDSPRGVHLCLELGVVRCEAVAVRGIGQVNRVALGQLQASERFLGKDDAEGVADREMLHNIHYAY